MGTENKGNPGKPKEGTARLSSLGEETALAGGSTKQEQTREELARGGDKASHWLCRSSRDKNGPFNVA